MGCRSCGQADATGVATSPRERGTVVVQIVKRRSERAPDDVIAARRSVCRDCEHSDKRQRRDGTLGLTTFSQCALCNCPIAGKTSDPDNACPDNRWGREEVAI